MTRIAIVGAGIGGLAAAGLLTGLGGGALEVTVFEQASELTDVGAGLVMSPNARRVLDVLGLGDALLDTAVELAAGFERRRWEDGTVLSVQPFTDLVRARYGSGMATVHRADLLALLRSAVPDAVLAPGRRCVDVDPGGDGRPARLEFADGPAVEADVVIGADGVHSRVRDVVSPSPPARYLGMSAFRALVPISRAPDFARRPVHTIWLGPGRHLVNYPVRSGELVNLAGVVETEQGHEESWTARGDPAELAAAFAGWDPQLRELVAQVDTTARWALLERAPLPRWTRGRVALLGDAAHAMPPFLAQGAAQALEDAVDLACCLTRSTTLDPVAALAEYDGRRRPRTDAVARVSQGLGRAINLPDGPEQRARDETFAEQDMVAALAWLHGHDPVAVARAG